MPGAHIIPLTADNDVLTQRDANTLVSAIHVLRELDRKGLQRWSFDTDAASVYWLGRMSEAADIAGDAVFNVLNLLSNGVESPRGKAAMRKVLNRD